MRQTAKRTFNERLGIVGGLSVLGTSGRVIPKSEDAWVRSLLPQVDVALADGRGHGVRHARAGSASGPRASGSAPGRPQIVQCSNFVGDLLDRCVDAGVPSAWCWWGTPASW